MFFYHIMQGKQNHKNIIGLFMQQKERVIETVKHDKGCIIFANWVESMIYWINVEDCVEWVVSEAITIIYFTFFRLNWMTYLVTRAKNDIHPPLLHDQIVV
jgi:hypothetical protein